MRVLFCNIAWMNYYKGQVDGKDVPVGGGSYVAKYHEAHEAFNFKAEYLTEDTGYPEGEYCLGFVETKTTNGKDRNQLKIENIEGYELFKNEFQVDDVLVIYCARYPDTLTQETYVVGWYKHAIVYRNYEKMEFSDGGDGIYPQYYNAIAKKEDCVLLPRGLRRLNGVWKVPRKTKGVAFGFGQANVWFANGRENNQFLDAFLYKIEKQINEYSGENWIDRSTE